MKKTAFVTKAIRILAAVTIQFACFRLTLFLPHEVKASTTSAEIREFKVSGTSIDFKGEPKFMPSQFNNSNYRMVSGVSQFNWNGQSFQLKTRYPVVGGTTTYTTNTGFYTSTSNSSRNTKGIYIPRGSNSQNRENFPSTNIPAVQCMLSAQLWRQNRKAVFGQGYQTAERPV